MSTYVQQAQGEPANKKKGLITSFILHTLLLLLVLLPFLSRQTPPPGQEGILISFGTPDEGEGEIQPFYENPETSTPSEPEPSEPIAEAEVKEPNDPPTGAADPLEKEPSKPKESEVVTDDKSKEIALARKKKKAKEEAEKKLKEAEEALKKAKADAKKKATAEAKRKAEEAERKAEEERKKLEEAKKQFGFPGSNNNSDGQGKTGKTGDQGAEDGKPDASNLEGSKSTGLGSDNIGGGLRGRGVDQRPTIKDQSQKSGKVRIKVCVDNSGKVSSADYTLVGSDTQDSYLIDLAKKSAKKYKFTSDDMAPSSQCGHIDFNFIVQ